jgi:hypothetical protein
VAFAAISSGVPVGAAIRVNLDIDPLAQPEIVY